MPLQLRLALVEWGVRALRPEVIQVIKEGRTYLPHSEVSEATKNVELGNLHLYIEGM